MRLSVDFVFAMSCLCHADSHVNYIYHACSIFSCRLQWNPDTLEPESTVLTMEVSSFEGLEMYCAWLIIVEDLVLVVCVHIRGVFAIQGAGLEEFRCNNSKILSKVATTIVACARYIIKPYQNLVQLCSCFDLIGHA